MNLSTPIYHLKRLAKQLARKEGIPRNEALDRIATKLGFRSWSHLANAHAKSTPARAVLDRLKPGDMALLGARPGQGKTLLGLEIVALRSLLGAKGWVFSLEDTETTIWRRLMQLGFDPQVLQDRICVDTSEAICADYIIDTVGKSAAAGLVLIDYLQILDLKRQNPALNSQLRALRAFCEEKGHILIFLCQIDRHFNQGAPDPPNEGFIRCPNPIDVQLFDHHTYLHQNQIHHGRPFAA